MENTVLFGKYRICRVIGTGQRGTVFLAVHERLREYRAIKRVSKGCEDYQQFYREGLILKDLRHPGIPVIYDLEEDESYCYLIEEFLEGDSLYDLVETLGCLSETAVIHYGIQICRIVNHLHSAGKIPILHLDLQPKNLLLCHETIKLIDFDRAATIDEANLTGLRYGTVGCAAPEQYTNQILDERTDIYAIGVLLHYLGSGYYPSERQGSWENKKLGQTIRTCLKKDKNRRYPSAQLLMEALEQAAGCTTDVFEHDQSSSLTVAVVGSKPGTGVTHLAFGLCAFFARRGYPCLYEEKNQSGTVLSLGDYFGRQPDEKGIFHICGCRLKPWYGACVKLKSIDPLVRILDFGTDIQAASGSQETKALVFMGGGMWWEAGNIKKVLENVEETQELIVVLPASILQYSYRIPQEIKKYPCYLVPDFPDPFRFSAKAESFYGSLVNEILDGKEMRRRPWLLKKIKRWKERIGRQ